MGWGAGAKILVKTVAIGSALDAPGMARAEADSRTRTAILIEHKKRFDRLMFADHGPK